MIKQPPTLKFRSPFTQSQKGKAIRVVHNGVFREGRPEAATIANYNKRRYLLLYRPRTATKVHVHELLKKTTSDGIPVFHTRAVRPAHQDALRDVFYLHSIHASFPKYLSIKSRK